MLGLSGTGVQVPWHGVQCGFFATKLSRLESCEYGKVVHCSRMQASCRVNEVGVSTAAADRSAAYYAVECTGTRVVVRKVVAPQP